MVLFINDQEINIREIDSEQTLKEYISFKFNLIPEFVNFSDLNFVKLYIDFKSTEVHKYSVETVFTYVSNQDFDFNTYMNKSVKLFERNFDKDWENLYIKSNYQNYYNILICLWIRNRSQFEMNISNTMLQNIFEDKNPEQCQIDYDNFIKEKKSNFEKNKCNRFSNFQINTYEKMERYSFNILPKSDNNIIVRMDLPLLVNIPNLNYIFNMIEVSQDIPISIYRNLSKTYFSEKDVNFLYNLTYDVKDNNFKFLENMISNDNLIFKLYQGKDYSNIYKKVYYSTCSCRINKEAETLELIIYIYFNEKEYSPVVSKTIQNYFNMNYNELNQLNTNFISNKDIFNSKINSVLEGFDENVINKNNYNTFICNLRSEFIIPRFKFIESKLLYILSTNEYFYKLFSVYEFEQLEETKGKKSKGKDTNEDMDETKFCQSSIQINYYDPLFKNKIKLTLHSCVRKFNDPKLKNIGIDTVNINENYTIVQIHNNNSEYILQRLLVSLEKLFKVYENFDSSEEKSLVKLMNKSVVVEKQVEIADKELQFLKEIAPEIFSDTKTSLSTQCQKVGGVTKIPTIYNNDTFFQIFDEEDIVTSLNIEHEDLSYKLLFVKNLSNKDILVELSDLSETEAQEILENVDTTNYEKFSESLRTNLQELKIGEETILKILNKMTLQDKYKLYVTSTDRYIGTFAKESKNNFKIKTIEDKNVDVPKKDIEIFNLHVIMEYKNYYFRCNNKPYLFPYLTNFKKANTFKMPCCAAKITIPKEQASQSTHTISTNKKLKYTHPNPQRGLVPKNITELLNISYIPNPGDNFYRRASFTNKNSFIFCVLYGLDKNNFRKIADDKTKIKETNDIINEYRNKLVENIDILNITKQQNFNYSLEEIREYILSTDKYFDPKMFIKLIEHIENVNIFLFTTNEVDTSHTIEYKDGIISYPYYVKGYYNTNKTHDNCLLIFEHNGTEIIPDSTPQCELIFLIDINNVQKFNFETSGSKNLVLRQSLFEFYKKNNKFYLNNSEIFNYDIKTEFIEKQYIDTFGKTRVLNFVSKDLDFCVETSPLEPLPIKNDLKLFEILNENKYSRVEVDFLLENFNLSIKEIFIENEKVKHVILNYTTEYPTFKINIKDSKPKNFMEFKHLFTSSNISKEKINIDSNISEFRLNKKLAKYTAEYLYYMFSRYLVENNILNKNDLSNDYIKLIEDFFNSQVVLSEIEDGNLYIIEKISFYFENKFNREFFLNDKGKLKVYGNKDTLQRLKYILNLIIFQQPDLILKYHSLKIMNNYYNDISDYNQDKNTLITNSLSNLISSIYNTRNFNNYVLEDSIKFLNINNLEFNKPYTLEHNENIYLMQNMTEGDFGNILEDLKVASSNSQQFRDQGINYSEDLDEIEDVNYNIMYYKNEELIDTNKSKNLIYIYKPYKPISKSSDDIVTGSMMKL
jgi:hypothetical protein